MSEKRIIDANTNFHYDHATDEFAIENHQDQKEIQAILDENQIARNEFHHKGEHMRKVAQIPTSLWNAWVKEDPDIARNQFKLLKKIKDITYNKLKTSDKI